MSATHLDPVRRNTARRRPLSAALLLAMLAIAAVSGLCATIATLSGAMMEQPSSVSQCAEIASGAARLACYDSLQNRTAPPATEEAKTEPRRFLPGKVWHLLTGWI